MRPSRHLALALLASTLTSCGSIPTKSFEIRAINFEGNPVPCLVVVNLDSDNAAAKQQYTDCEVTVSFEKPRVNIKVLPTRYDASGNVVRPDAASTMSQEYYPESRDLTPEDPRIHLFVLRANPDWTGS